VAQFGAVDVALSLTVEGLEGLQELSQRARVVVWVRAHCLEDRQYLLELVRLLSYADHRHHHAFIKSHQGLETGSFMVHAGDR